MSAPRILFANATNSPRSGPRSPFNHHLKKSYPTCTVSLANASTNDVSIALSSMSPFLAPSFATSLVPFPCTSVDGWDTPISQADTSSCLQLLRSSPRQPPPGGKHAPTGASQPAPERRKRSTARLLQPVSPHLGQDSASEAGSQPPRKRPRLQKVGKGFTKSAAKRTCCVTSDLRFTALAQRSIASGVKERQQRRSRPSADPSATASGGETMFEALDILLVGRLRTHLLARGLKRTDVIDLNDDLADDRMDVDVDVQTSPPYNHRPVSVETDIDVETRSGPRSSPPPSSPPRQISTSSPMPPLSPPKLVANLIMRHHTQRKSSRSPASSEQNGVETSRGKPRRPSPLAHSILESTND